VAYVTCVRCGHQNLSNASFCGDCKAVLPRFLASDEVTVRNVAYSGVDGDSHEEEHEKPDLLGGLRRLEGYMLEGSLSMEEYTERIQRLGDSILPYLDQFIEEDHSFLEGCKGRYEREKRRKMTPEEEESFEDFRTLRRTRLQEMQALFSDSLALFLKYSEYGDPVFMTQGLELAEEAQKLLYSLEDITGELMCKFPEEGTPEIVESA
jgi:hypothetical protein